MTRLLRVEIKTYSINGIAAHAAVLLVSHDPFISDAEVERLLLNVLK